MTATRRRLVSLVAAAAAALVAAPSAWPHGGQVAPEDLPGAWRPEPVVLLAGAVALALFAQGFVRLRRRGRRDHASWARAWLFLAGIAVALAALMSPLDAVGEQYLASGHMLQHVLVGDVAPALLVVAVRGPLLFFLLPSDLMRAVAHSWLRRFAAWLLRPKVSFAVWALVLGAWHVPALYDAALRYDLAHDLQHMSFLAAGIFVWVQLVDPARSGRLGFARRIGFAVGLFAVGTVLSDVLIFSFRPLYGLFAEQPERLFGISPLLDQQLAGVVMMVEQLLVLGLFVILLSLDRRRSAERAGVGRDAATRGNVSAPARPDEQTA